MLPVPSLWGSTTIVYVPVEGSAVASTKPPPPPKLNGPTSVLPSGRTRETRVAQQTGPSFTLTTWPAVPAKVSRAFWPGTVVVTVADAPPGTIDAVTSAGTS